MIATSDDVARKAGVSRSTVSQILNGHGDLFTAKTRERVQKAVTELGYEPSSAGRALARGSSDIVIALIPNTTFGSNLQAIFDVLTDELAERGLTLVLRLSTHTPAALDRIIIGMKPRAVLSLTPFTDEDREVLEARGVLAVDPGIAVSSDLNREVGRVQAEHLIQRGHQRLAYAHLSDTRGDPFGQGREQAFREEAARSGIPEVGSIQLSIDPDAAFRALEQLDPRGVAVACYNDDVAMALMFAAQQRGWTIPNDIALIGMDHTPLSKLTNPTLTTLDYDLPSVTTRSVAAILATLDQQPDALPTSPPRLALIEGATT